jgi:hypothetical protein
VALRPETGQAVANFAIPYRFPKTVIPMAALLLLSLNMTACVSAEKDAGLGEIDVPADPKMLVAGKPRQAAPETTTPQMPQTQPDIPDATDTASGQQALPGQIMMETQVAASRRSIFASEPSGDTGTTPGQSDATMAYAAPRTMNPVQSSLFGGTPLAEPPQDEATPAPAEQPIVPLTAEESQAYDDPVVTVPAKGQMESADPAPVDVLPAEPKKKSWSISDLFAGFHKKKAP